MKIKSSKIFLNKSEKLAAISKNRLFWGFKFFPNRFFPLPEARILKKHFKYTFKLFPGWDLKVCSRSSDFSLVTLVVPG